jgi:hypothetical protein
MCRAAATNSPSVRALSAGNPLQRSRSMKRSPRNQSDSVIFFPRKVRKLIPVTVQQHSSNLPPLVIQRGFRVGLVRTLVPISRVLRVPLPAMEIGMNPSRFLSGRVVLGNVMGTIEIPPGIPPKSLEQGRQARRRHPLAQRSTEFFDRHGRILRCCRGRRRAVDGNRR